MSAFVPIPGHPRSEDEYHRLATPLRMLALEGPLITASMCLEDCWLNRYLEVFYPDRSKVTHSTSDNPHKNTLNYHIVQAQKFEFLSMAAAACDHRFDVYVWIDYGIFHVPGVTKAIVRDFLSRVGNERTIAIPGCWGPDYKYDDDNPCWRFCGGVMVVPREYVEALDEEVKREYTRWLYEHDHVSWEVNVLARIERQGTKLPIWHYFADHDASMFTNYRKPEFGDRIQSANRC